MIEYNIPVEVTEKQYKELTNKFSGIIASRKEDGKFYIKLWMMKYKFLIEEILKNH